VARCRKRTPVARGQVAVVDRNLMRAPMTTTVERYPVLDGIRGTAILMVSASHFSNLRDLPFSGAGQFGVWLFFVLSAFLLSSHFFTLITRVVEFSADAESEIYYSIATFDYVIGCPTGRSSGMTLIC
jgi:hypothetical protein